MAIGDVLTSFRQKPPLDVEAQKLSSSFDRVGLPDCRLRYLRGSNASAAKHELAAGAPGRLRPQKSSQQSEKRAPGIYRSCKPLTEFMGQNSRMGPAEPGGQIRDRCSGARPIWQD